MNLLKEFDTAIATSENTPRGYWVAEKCYDSYMSNDSWAAYLNGMSASHRGQYGDGSGGELKEKNGLPPKMASFASSSRMTYRLSKDIPDSRDMKVAFFCRGKEVVHFDIKQMLCHLLGVANQMLTDRIFDAPIQFLYLLYNPTGLAISQDNREKILNIYRDTCETAENYAFAEVFGYVVDFLLENKTYQVTETEVAMLKNNFRFTLCDQGSYADFFK